MNYLELLAPAKNIECGIAAIDHGADAVYIGAERFGARAEAGNSVRDIAELCKYAHVFKAKVYVTVNTIIYDNELQDTEKLIWELYRAGVDAILVQDMGILKMQLPPITLHASTQTDNRTAEKVAWLAAHGFKRVVLARELSLDEIAEIHSKVPTVELEAFVHGALCVSYSGQCYASQYCFNRSANRGECAQFCRLKFNLEDTNGHTIIRDKHLLSLKDVCRIGHIKQMAEAGVTSFKIEGRLKDIAYVKNVTAAYSQKLDEIVRHAPETYRRASLGKCRYTFTPNLNKTFNRGFTDYFLTGRHDDITSFDTPKAMGEYVGKVKEIKGETFTVAGTAAFANGDGLCFINEKHELEGFRVNKAEGNSIHPLKMPATLKRGTRLYRNNDKTFEDLLSKKSATRKISIWMTLSATDDGFELTASATEGTGAQGKTATERPTVSIKTDKDEALKPQRDNIIKQLSKLGNTPFECQGVKLRPETFNYFIPSSVLADMRREVVSLLEKTITDERTGDDERQDKAATTTVTPLSGEQVKTSYLLNVSNKLARSFYEDDGLTGVEDALELKRPANALLMQCRHCLRYSLGRCPKRGGNISEWHEPLYLRLPDGRRFKLRFDCNNCKMDIYADN